MRSRRYNGMIVAPGEHPSSFLSCEKDMEKITREEALKRWESAKKQKKAMVEKMRKALYEDYKARTGEEPLTFNVL